MATRFVCPCFVCKAREAFHVTTYVGGGDLKNVAVCDACYQLHALSNGAPAEDIIGFGTSVQLGQLIMEAWDSDTDSETTTEEEGEGTASTQEGSEVGSTA